MILNLKEIDNANLDSYLKDDSIVILDFYTKFCPSCRMVTASLEEFEEQRPDVIIVEIEATDYPEIASIYKVKTAPTLLFFHNGKHFGTHNGFIDVDDLFDYIKEL